MGGTALCATSSSTAARFSAASSMPQRSTCCCATMRRGAPTARAACGVCSISSCGTARSSIRKAFKRSPMRILWLKSDLLLPLDKGGKLRTWHLLRHLSRRHEITYVAFADPDHSPADVSGMSEVAAHVETIPRTDPPKRSLRFYADAALH